MMLGIKLENKFKDRLMKVLFQGISRCQNHIINH